jgi:hypothetical protein
MPEDDLGGLPDLGSPEANEAREVVIGDIANAAGVDFPVEKSDKETEGGEEQPGKEEGAAPAAEAKPAEAAAPAQPTPGAVGEEKPAPDTWTPAARAKWAAIDPDVKKDILRREANIASYVQETAPAVNVAKSVERIVSPYMETFNKYGVNPFDHVAGLLAGHYQILFGTPEQKVAMFRQLAKDAGINLGAVADPNSQPAGAVNQEFLNQLRIRDAKIAELEQMTKGVVQTIQQERTTELEKGIIAFAQQHEDFFDLADDIKHLVATGAAKSLVEAYDLASLRNPVSRAKRLENAAAERAAKVAADNAARVAAARKASGANVRSRGNGRAAPVDASIDDTLKETLKEIHSRN